MQIKIILVVAILLLVQSCTSKMAQTWTEPDYSVDKTYQKIAVFGIHMEKSTTKTFENTMSQQLINNGYEAIPGSSLFQANSINWSDPDREMIRRVLRDNDVDGVLLTSVVDEQTRLQYRRETDDYYTAENYFWFSNYYPSQYSTTSKTGYYDSYDTYILENHFYEVEDSNGDGKGLVWVGESEIVDPASAESASKSFSKVLYKTLRKDKILN